MMAMTLMNDARTVNSIMSDKHPELAFDHIVWLVETLEMWNSGRNNGKKIIISADDLKNTVPSFKVGCFLRKVEEDEGGEDPPS